jgi:hypothetical protein
MSPRTESHFPPDFDTIIPDPEMASVMERVQATVTDPTWYFTVNKNHLKIGIESMVSFVLIKTPRTLVIDPDRRYWTEQHWSVVCIQSDQPNLYKQVAYMMELIASWAVTTQFELHGMAKQGAILVEDKPYQQVHTVSGSGTIQTLKGEKEFSFPDKLMITRTDNKEANNG